MCTHINHCHHVLIYDANEWRREFGKSIFCHHVAELVGLNQNQRERKMETRTIIIHHQVHVKVELELGKHTARIFN